MWLIWLNVRPSVDFHVALCIWYPGKKCCQQPCFLIWQNQLLFFCCCLHAVVYNGRLISFLRSYLSIELSVIVSVPHHADFWEQLVYRPWIDFHCLGSILYLFRNYIRCKNFCRYFENEWGTYLMDLFINEYIRRFPDLCYGCSW